MLLCRGIQVSDMVYPLLIFAQLRQEFLDFVLDSLFGLGDVKLLRVLGFLGLELVAHIVSLVFVKPTEVLLPNGDFRWVE